MTKRDFLLSLSKDELVELIFGFSETNQEACDFIQKKIYQAEAFGQNNKQENLLENPKAMNAEVSAAEISADTNTINRFSSPEEKIALFKSLFSGRTDRRRDEFLPMYGYYAVYVACNLYVCIGFVVDVCPSVS